MADRSGPATEGDAAGTAIERRLERLVRENRFTIAVVFPLVGGVLLVASAEGWLPAALAFNPYLVLGGTLVMRLPLAVGLLPLLDRRAIAALLALVAYTYAIELVGVATGFPYGTFAYGVELGPMLFGTVPAGLPAFFVPLVANGYLLVLALAPRTVGRPALRVGAAVGVVIAVDLVLDPAAVALGFWTYADGGVYYGVPRSNYAGWLLSGSVAVGLVAAAVPADALATRLDDCEFVLDDLVSFVLLWGAVNVYFGNWIPVAVAGGLFGALLYADRFDFGVRRTGRRANADGGDR